jgi:hypothetical protein
MIFQFRDSIKMKLIGSFWLLLSSLALLLTLVTIYSPPYKMMDGFLVDHSASNTPNVDTLRFFLEIGKMNVTLLISFFVGSLFQITASICFLKKKIWARTIIILSTGLLFIFSIMICLRGIQSTADFIRSANLVWSTSQFDKINILGFWSIVVVISLSILTPQVLMVKFLLSKRCKSIFNNA